MAKLIEIFPKCLYIQDNVCVNYLPSFKEKIYELKNKTIRSPLLNVNTSHSKIQNLDKETPFDILSEEILKHVSSFMKQYGYVPGRENDAYIRNFWFNISNKDDFLFPHIHYGSFLSGAFYVETQQDNVILFHDEAKNYYEDPGIETKFSETIKPFICKPGRLILFTSNLTHSTPPQKSDGEKIVISFNVSLENSKNA